MKRWKIIIAGAIATLSVGMATRASAQLEYALITDAQLKAAEAVRQQTGILSAKISDVNNGLLDRKTRIEGAGLLGTGLFDDTKTFQMRAGSVETLKFITKINFGLLEQAVLGTPLLLEMKKCGAGSEVDCKPDDNILHVTSLDPSANVTPSDMLLSSSAEQGEAEFTAQAGTDRFSFKISLQR